MEDGSRLSAPTTQVKDPEEAPGLCFYPGQALVIVANWEANQVKAAGKGTRKRLSLLCHSTIQGLLDLAPALVQLIQPFHPSQGTLGYALAKQEHFAKCTVLLSTSLCT